MKTCRVCKTAKPLAEFYAHPNTSDRRAGICKACQRAYIQARYNRKRPVWPDGQKRCPRCRRVLLLEAFASDAARPDGRQAYCKECWPEYQRYWRKRPEAGFAATEKTKRQQKTPVGALKQRARLLTSLAAQFGYLTRQPCEVCGSPETEAHHTQYEKPLDGLRWFCAKHHLEVGHGGRWDNPGT